MSEVLKQYNSLAGKCSSKLDTSPASQIIEKMYKNARINKTATRASCVRAWCGGEICVITNKKCKRKNKAKCKNFKGNILGGEYPPFTAEKQLLLIQWLAKTRPIHISFLIDKWVLEDIVRYGKRYDTFNDSLAGYVNQIWQYLTEQEQELIRRILEC